MWLESILLFLRCPRLRGVFTIQGCLGIELRVSKGNRESVEWWNPPICIAVDWRQFSVSL